VLTDVCCKTFKKTVLLQQAFSWSVLCVYTSSIDLGFICFIFVKCCHFECKWTAMTYELLPRYMQMMHFVAYKERNDVSYQLLSAFAICDSCLHYGLIISACVATLSLQ